MVTGGAFPHLELHNSEVARWALEGKSLFTIPSTGRVSWNQMKTYRKTLPKILITQAWVNKRNSWAVVDSVPWERQPLETFDCISPIQQVTWLVVFAATRTRKQHLKFRDWFTQSVAGTVWCEGDKCVCLKMSAFQPARNRIRTRKKTYERLSRSAFAK